MKFPVITKLQKKCLIFFEILIVVLIIGIGLLLKYLDVNIVNQFNEWNLVQKIFISCIMIIMCLLLLFAWLASLYLAFSHIEINEKGIELHLGKVVINKMPWQEIQWVETFYEENIYLRRQHIVAVTKGNKMKYKKVRHFFLQNFTRNKITFLYNKVAMDLIKEHCNCFIYGQDLIE